MSLSKQVIDDLNEAIERDRLQAFEAGRLQAHEEQFEARQSSYRSGVANERLRIFQALKAIGSGGDFYETRWSDLLAIFETEKEN